MTSLKYLMKYPVHTHGYYITLRYLGLRTAEGSALKSNNWDWKTEMVKIRMSFSGRQLLETVKEDNPDELPIPQALRRSIKPNINPERKMTVATTRFY